MSEPRVTEIERGMIVRDKETGAIGIVEGISLEREVIFVSWRNSTRYPDIAIADVEVIG